MTSSTTESFREGLARLSPRIQRQARKAYHLFRSDPSHRSLQFKRVDPERPIFSARVSRGYRAMAIKDGDDLVWFWIGSHAEYDKILNRR